jgi:hypothetical protein
MSERTSTVRHLDDLVARMGRARDQMAVIRDSALAGQDYARKMGKVDGLAVGLGFAEEQRNLARSERPDAGALSVELDSRDDGESNRALALRLAVETLAGDKDNPFALSRLLLERAQEFLDFLEGRP